MQPETRPIFQIDTDNRRFEYVDLNGVRHYLSTDSDTVTIVQSAINRFEITDRHEYFYASTMEQAQGISDKLARQR